MSLPSASNSDCLIFDTNGKCLFHLLNQTKNSTNDNDDYHQILYGLVLSLKSFNKRLLPPRINYPHPNDYYDNDYFWFQNSRYRLIYYESLTGMKFILIISSLSSIDPKMDYRRMIGEFYNKIYLKCFLFQMNNNQQQQSFNSIEFRKELLLFLQQKLKI